jgi:hypothetical protein
MDEIKINKGLTVRFGEVFINRFNNYPIKDQEKIADFASHIDINGFAGLPGRNKSSTDVDKNDHHFIKRLGLLEKTAFIITILVFQNTIKPIKLVTGHLNISCITNILMA